MKTNWIPVSERLPEKNGRYLAYIINPYDDKLRYSMTCEYFPSEGWCPDDECASDNVVAWMPLPEEYEEPKMGQWVLLDECANSGYYCSECHKKIVKEGWSDTVKKIKYCPNCGAKMEGLGA